LIRALFLSFQSSRTGAPTWLRGMLAHLNRQCVNPAVLFNYDGPIVSDIAGIVPTHILPKVGLRGLPCCLREPLRRRWQRATFDRVVSTFRPQAFYLNTVGAGPGAMAALQQQDIPVIVHVHEMNEVVLEGLDAEWLDTLLARGSLFVAASEAVAEFLMRCLAIPASAIVLCRSSIDTPSVRLQAAGGRERIRTKLGLTERSILVVNAGKPSFGKGVDLFIEAAAALRHRHPTADLHFMWVGGHSGIHAHPYLRAMRDLVHSRELQRCFHWVSQVESASPYLAAADLFAFSSRGEAMGLAMLEAMALGKPVVAFAVGGIPEAVGRGGGVLVERVAAESLADALGHLLTSPDKWGRYGAAGQQVVERHFDIRQNARVVEAAIEAVVSRTRGVEISPAASAFRAVGSLD
jgi:glycosyltransferase involved in cell wall biosynthesis